VSAARTGGLLPSEKVSMQMKFSATSFPNSFNISLKIYFYDAVNLASVALTTKTTA